MVIMPDLQKMLEYSNDDVISRFCAQLDVPEAEAKDILKETIKFLYLSQNPAVFIPDELLIIDEMWHNFILFTREYHDFSQQHFQRYIHHRPATKAEKEEQQKLTAENPALVQQEYLKKFELLLNETFDVLGEETVEKWFEVYPVQYSKEKIKQLRKN
jgi:hypothetical protein